MFAIDLRECLSCDSDVLQITSHTFNSTDSLIRIIEKVHAFFHFEQSYFHWQLALYYADNNILAEFQHERTNALFQDPQNEEAKLWPIPTTNKYNRLFINYHDYTYWLLHSKKSYTSCNYWAMLENTTLNHDILQQVLTNIKKLHQQYHIIAGKLYYNRSQLWGQKQQWMHAYADAIKAVNLYKDLQTIDSYTNWLKYLRIMEMK